MKVEFDFEAEGRRYYVTCEFENWNNVEKPQIYLDVAGGPFNVDGILITDLVNPIFRDYVLSLVMQEIQQRGYWDTPDVLEWDSSSSLNPRY